MPTNFFFDSNSFNTDDYLALSDLSRGSGLGVNDSTQASAIAASQKIDFSGDVDIVAVTLIAGQDYTFDIDDGYGDSSGGSIDLELDLIDAQGRLILNVDDAPGTDNGSVSSRDPRETFSIDTTGTYYIAVHAQADEYRDERFAFTKGGAGTGDYRLVVSSPDLPGRELLSNSSNNYTASSGRDNIQALGGSDRVFLLGGQDLAAGGSGSDSLYGGSGSDELSGGSGNDLLDGGNEADVLIGGADRDRLFGDDGDDGLNGSGGRDSLFGDAGRDELLGGSGDDKLYGGSEADFLRGGGGADSLYGGGGADVFFFVKGDSPYDSQGFHEDRINAFSSDDTIDLTALGNLTWRNERAFSGSNQVRQSDVRDQIGYVEVQVNLDSDSRPELSFLVDRTNNGLLTQSDFDL